jgi:hypothetical protein
MCTKRIAIGIIALSIASGCDNGVATDAEPEPDAFVNPNLPPDWQPWEWNGYEKFPSLYFAAEPEGYFSEEQMEKITQLY